MSDFVVVGGSVVTRLFTLPNWLRPYVVFHFKSQDHSHGLSLTVHNNRRSRSKALLICKIKNSSPHTNIRGLDCNSESVHQFPNLLTLLHFWPKFKSLSPRQMPLAPNLPTALFIPLLFPKQVFALLFYLVTCRILTFPVVNSSSSGWNFDSFPSSLIFCLPLSHHCWLPHFWLQALNSYFWQTSGVTLLS